MRILNDHFSLLKVNMVLVAFVLALVLIIIAMKLNHQMRYASFLVISTYIICTILQVAIFLAFMWYWAIPIGLLLSDLASKWVKKELAVATEEEKKGGYGLTKKRRMEQIEQYVQKASPVEMNRVKKMTEKPVEFKRAMFMTGITAMGFLIAIIIMIV